MSEENKALVRHFLNELWTKKNPGIRAELTAPGYPSSAEGDALQAAFDFRLTIEEQIAEGDKVATRVSLSGTQTKEFQGVAPTGKSVAFGITFIHRIEEGKLADRSVNADRLGLMQQIGGIPS